MSTDHLKSHFSELRKLGFRRDFKATSGYSSDKVSNGKMTTFIYKKDGPDHSVEVHLNNVHDHPDDYSHSVGHFYNGCQNERHTEFKTIPEMHKAIDTQMLFVHKKRTGWKSPNDLSSERYDKLTSAHREQWKGNSVGQAFSVPEHGITTVSSEGRSLNTKWNSDGSIEHKWSNIGEKH